MDIDLDTAQRLRIARLAQMPADLSATSPIRLPLPRDFVWNELAAGLLGPRPSRMLESLRPCGTLRLLLPEVDALWGVPQPEVHHPEIDTGVHVMMVVDTAARLGANLAVRFACLTHDLGKATTPADVLPRHLGHEARSVDLLEQLCRRLGVPDDLAATATVVAREHGNIHGSLKLSGSATARLLERCNAFEQPERFIDVLLACECDARGRLGFEDRPYPQRARLLQALEVALAVDVLDIGEHLRNLGRDEQAVDDAVRSARVAALRSELEVEVAAPAPFVRRPGL